ncbi:MAG: DUF3987 domain-containing protein, partial [Verrucomicrobiota bacterium]
LVMVARQCGYECRHVASPTPPALYGAEKGEVPSFPIHCLPGVAGEMAREIGRVTTSMNEALAAVAVLGVLSASIGAGLQVGTGGERNTRGNLSILGIAESGTGKGEAYNLAVEPFASAEAEVIERFDLSERPGLVAELRISELRAKKLCAEAAKESDQHGRALLTQQYREAEEDLASIQRRIDSAPRWRVADVTQEKLAIVMQGQPGEALASMSSEARGILNVVRGKYSKDGGDEAFYCSAYSGDSVTVDRVGRAGVTLHRPCLSILWLVQPDAARKAFGEESFTESGLLPRFLVFDPKAEPQVRTEQPEPIPAATKTSWGNLIRSLVGSHRMRGAEPRSVTVSRQARDLLADVERQNVRSRQRGGALRDIAPYVARWTENTWRLALVLHAARHSADAHFEEMDLTTAQAAVEIARWFQERQSEVLHCGRQERATKRLNALVALLGVARGEISFGKLSHAHGFEEGEIRHLQSLFPYKIKIEQRKPALGRPTFTVSCT